MNAKYLLLLLAVFAISFSNAYISAITVDQPNGQIYVAADQGILYELDDVAVEQNGVHYLPSNATSEALFVGKAGNKAALFAYLEPADSNLLGNFKLPLGNQQTLPLRKSVPLSSGLSIQAVFDNADRIAVLSVSRNLTLVDLNSLTILDSFRYFQNRVFGINVVYNHNNNHLIVLSSRVPIRGNYGLSVDEWDLSTGKFVDVPTSYNCLCNDGYNLTASPFYKVVLDRANCEIDYATNKLWCSNSENNRLFVFNAANLSDFSVINVPLSWSSVAWDFSNNFAYLISGNYEAKTFTIYKINRNTAALVAQYTNTQYAIDTDTYYLDRDQPHLYIAVYNDLPGEPETLISVNVNTMATAKVVALNKNDLN